MKEACNVQCFAVITLSYCIAPCFAALRAAGFVVSCLRHWRNSELRVHKLAALRCSGRPSIYVVAVNNVPNLASGQTNEEGRAISDSVRSKFMTDLCRSNTLSRPSQDNCNAGTFGMLLRLGTASRIALLLYGALHDRLSAVKYTDIDYNVFTDAAAFVAKGLSPYLRSTYRYSPLLAWTLVPNVLLHPAWGKALFCAADLLAAWSGLITSAFTHFKLSKSIGTADYVLIGSSRTYYQLDRFRPG